MKQVMVYRNAAGQKHEPLFPRVQLADGFWSRLRGLLARPPLQEGEGLLLTPCNQIHTLGMGYALDVVYLDKAGTILGCITALKPNRISMEKNAAHTLELKAGAVARAGLQPGDSLFWQ